ncbi:MAG: hypothetical protein ACXAB4_10255, partial [Candidatus Hodarchaeales archaeon]
IKSLEKTGYVQRTPYILPAHARTRFYRLTDLTLNGLELALEAQDEPLALVRSKLPFAEFQRFAGRADTYNLLTHAVAVYFNWWDEEGLDLYTLSNHLAVNPRLLLREILPYVAFDEESRKKKSQSILQMKVGRPF